MSDPIDPRLTRADVPADASDFVDDALIDRYLAGECSAAERARVERQLDRRPNGVRLLYGIADRAGATDPPVLDAPDALQQFHARRAARDPTMQERQPGSAVRSAVRRSPASGRRWIPWTVGIAVGAAAAAVVIATGGHSRAGHRAGHAEQQYATRSGQRATITLADGSHVMLAPESRLVVDASGRAVRLDGEAIFDVVDGRGTPFTVQTGRVTTRVLGTRFDVRRYAHDPHTRVVVTTGKVSVSAATRWQPSIILAAGSVGLVTDSTATAVSTPDPSRLTAWTDGDLVFDRAPVSDVLEMLSRWYGYKFYLADSTLRDQHLTTTVDYNNPRQAFARLQVLLNVDLDIHGDSVTLRPRTHALESHRSTIRRDRERDLSPTKEIGR